MNQWNETKSILLLKRDKRPITHLCDHSSLLRHYQEQKEAPETSRLVRNIITVEPLDSISSALKWSDTGKVAVLNFANPYRPALGVPKHHTQEEAIMRATDLGLYLYNDLEHLQGNRHYPFNPHKGELIYCVGVQCVKTPHTFDVITASSLIHPKVKNGTYANECDYKTMERIVDSIFLSAIKHRVDVLLLGAFGCGAFKCPVEPTAEIMFTASKKYQHHFKQIVFPVPILHKNDKMFETFKRLHRVHV